MKQFNNVEEEVEGEVEVTSGREEVQASLLWSVKEGGAYFGCETHIADQDSYTQGSC